MDWNDALRRLDGAVAQTFDLDTVTVSARTRGLGVNAETIADATRPEFTRLASIERGPEAVAAYQRLAGDPAASREPVHFEAVMTADVTDWPWLPRRDDLVASGSDRWKVASEIAESGRRPAFFLNRAG